MKVHIDFTGVPRVLCQVGIHNWFPEDAITSTGYKIYKLCHVCGKEKTKKVK